MAEKNQLVSIIVCTYNGEKFLHQQLESLVNQTYKNLEIIISDDGSTDKTLHIARELVTRDSRIIIHSNPSNLGYNKNFEQAFFLASGDFIAISDQDDIWEKEKIARMLPLFTDDDVSLVHCQSIRFAETIPPKKTYTARRLFNGNDVRKLMYFNTIAGHNMIFRKKLLSQQGPFPENVFYDWWLTIVAATYGTIQATGEVLTFHRLHTANITLGKKDEGKQTREKAEERLHTLKAILQLKDMQPLHKAFAQELLSALTPLEHKRFSLSLFSFLSRNSHILFFFKKKSMLSRIKMAYRMSFAVS